MSQAFTFPPPPPPPPPKPVQNSHGYQQNGTRGGPRGRGGAHFSQHAGRGRGHHPPRGGQRGTYGARGNLASSVNRGAYSSQPATYNSPSHGSSASLNPSHKRDHYTAFSPRSDHAAKNNRPRAPPPTPSFGADLEKLIQKGQPAEPSARHANKANILGLTPAARDSDSEDDAEEEAKLAGSTDNHLLQFEYNGQTSTLSTPEEIAAWITERRKKWPTEEKREAARKEAEEKRKKWEAEKAARSEAARTTAKARYEERQKQKLEREKSQVRQRLLKEHVEKSKAPTSLPENRPAAQLKAERLTRKAEMIAQRLKTAEAALDKQDASADGGGLEGDDLETLLAKVDSAAAVQLVRGGGGGGSVAISDRSSDTSNESSADPCADMAEDTSTSGSSDSDSDSAPEETTSKRDGPERVLPPARKGSSGLKAITDNRPLCKSFAETSRCKFGRRCRYKHERPTKKNGSTADNRRKGLYQVMVEKELEEERKQALRAIIELGDAGVL